MASVPPPWHLEGEALVLFARAGARPRLLAVFHYSRSPVGPFVELVTGEIRIAGGHLQLRPTLLAVGSSGARDARAGWLPEQEPGTLKWWAEGTRREVYWEERGLRLRAETGRNDVPATLPLRLVHPAWAAESGPSRLRARMTPARVEVEAPEGDVLSPLTGARLGALFSSARLALDESRGLLPRSRRAAPLADVS